MSRPRLTRLPPCPHEDVIAGACDRYYRLCPERNRDPQGA